MHVAEPVCYKCKFNMKGTFRGIGKAPACKEYPNGRPTKVFYEAGKCGKFKPVQEVKKKRKNK